jgi:hypothetical protein
VKACGPFCLWRVGSILLTNMGFLDAEQERRKLAEFYAGLTDGELEKLDEESDSLTAIAREALEDELELRELVESLETEQPPQTDIGLRKLITVRNFRDLPEALLAKGSLESMGIECFLADDNLIRLDWFISNFVGGIKLRVKPEDAAQALEVLDQPIPPGMYVEGVGLYEQPHCPKCDSLDISFQGLNKPVAYGTAWLGIPIPLQRNSWKCHACEEEWQGE